MELVFEWDVEKEQENIRLHGVNFTDASQVFNDYFRMERHDDDSFYRLICLIAVESSVLLRFFSHRFSSADSFLLSIICMGKMSPLTV